MDEDLQASVEPDSYCCLLDEGQRCQNLATTATWSKRANKNIGSKLKLFTDPEAGHKYICEHHNSVVYQMKAKRRRRDSDDDSDLPQMEIDFSQLQMNTLRRYKRHFKLQVKPGMNKAQLAEVSSMCWF
jgi:histone deacetylase complex subunit SAP30